MQTQRMTRLIDAMRSAGLDALALNPSPSLVYMTGLHLHLSERPVVALFTLEGKLAVVVPEFEAPRARSSGLAAQFFSYGDTPATWPEAFAMALAALNLDGKQIGIEPNAMRVLELRMLEAGAPGAQFPGAQGVVTTLRITKDENELALMQQAANIAQEALRATLPAIRPGATEREIAAELTLQLLRHGSDLSLPFSPIIASGPNSADPHATPSDRRLAPGDLLVVDWGASVGGYYSDITRTFAIGAVEPELTWIAEVVLTANRAGCAAAGPQVSAGDVDLAARAAIQQAGYGPYFTHRTGHGLGMEPHEDPYMFSGNPQLLLPGMSFTIEPGIYLPGRGGVRIEDDVVITPDGARSLTDLPRELWVV